MLYPNPQIYHALKAIFVHVPKSAGTLIEKHLRDLSPPLQKCGGHSTALGFRHGFPNEFASYFKFAVVRHPLDRFLSAFYYLQQMPVHHALNNQAAHDSNSPDEFVAQLVSDASLAPKIVHLLPQWQFVCDRSGEIVVDQVYRFESLATGWRDISARLKLPVLPLAKLNRSRRPVEPASAAVTQYVRATFSRDYELFEYQ